MQYQGENGKNPNFGPDMWFPKIFFMGLTSKSNWRMFQAIIIFNFQEN